jgi:phage shock protein PspC (stress-responsive transcriptional regulator)
MPEYLPVIVIGIALPILTTIAYIVAWVWPEPGPDREDADSRAGR